MSISIHPALSRRARGLTAALIGAAVFSLTGPATAQTAPQDIRWGTGPVGSSGHKALVVLADMLNKEMPELRISVLPFPGAVGTVKSFATGELDGYYGSDVALKEFAQDIERFKDFKSKVKIQPVQSFWCYTLDVGVAVKGTELGNYKSWSDLTGKEVYTGPLPFDTRKHLENGLKALGVKHIYKQVDLKTAGSQLDSGRIKGMIVYAAGGKTPAPWISEASLSVDWEALNPSAAEVAKLKEKKFGVQQVPATNFHKKDAKVKNITLLPFYWGFDVGLSVSEAGVYKMLTIIEKHADELAKLDPSFSQIAGGNMASFQKAALESTSDIVPIHPGLVKYMKEKKMWDASWDAHIAKAKM